MEDEVFLSRNEQEDLLQRLLNEAVSQDDVNRYHANLLNREEEHDGDYAYFDEFQETGYSVSGASASSSSSVVVRRAQGSGFQHLSGAADIAYAEVDAPGGR